MSQASSGGPNKPTPFKPGRGSGPIAPAPKPALGGRPLPGAKPVGGAKPLPVPPARPQIKPGYQNKGLTLGGRTIPKPPPKPAHLTPGYQNLGPHEKKPKVAPRPPYKPAHLTPGYANKPPKAPPTPPPKPAHIKPGYANTPPGRAPWNKAAAAKPGAPAKPGLLGSNRPAAISATSKLKGYNTAIPNNKPRVNVGGHRAGPGQNQPKK